MKIENIGENLRHIMRIRRLKKSIFKEKKYEQCNNCPFISRFEPYYIPVCQSSSFHAEKPCPCIDCIVKAMCNSVCKLRIEWFDIYGSLRI